MLIYVIFQVTAPLKTPEFRESASCKGHFALYNYLVLGHTKCNGVERIYCNPFPAKPFHGSHRLDMVMIRPPGIENGAFVLSPDTVWWLWYARVLLLFSASATTDTGSKSLKCAIVSTLETYNDPENGNYYCNYLNYTEYMLYSLMLFRLAGICRFPSPIRAQLQETNSLRYPCWKYPGKTASSSCRWHWNHSAQHAQSFSRRARRSRGGFRGRKQDVLCQLVGFGLVPRYVMKAVGVEGTLQDGVRHIHCIISIMWIMSVISIGMN